MRSRLTIQTLDLHAGGEPLRLVTAGYPPLPHAPILERRRWVREHADHVRRAICWEPRGHRDMYGAVLAPPFRPDADVAVLFMHNEGYSTMCGHGILALTAGLLEEGLMPATAPETTVRFETPAGLVVARAAVRPSDGSVEVDDVRFTNVPAYLAARDLALRPDGLAFAGAAAERGTLRVDIGFGGAYYGIVDAAELGLRVVPAATDALTRAGSAVTELLRRDHTPAHPEAADLGFVYGTIIVDREPGSSPDGRALDADLRNVTVFADAEVDRSPCGTGTCALLAQGHARGELAVGTEIANASLTGAIFRGRIDGLARLGPHDAIFPSVAGRGYVTGYQTLVVDTRDDLGAGFVLR
ncbi:MAG TPA: proline racemase family protein [Candidatus Saccharimonadales bacterium]|nr:proline racemase family protein [Candidatus Saccharimonadales bacterium]